MEDAESQEQDRQDVEPETGEKREVKQHLSLSLSDAVARAEAILADLSRGTFRLEHRTKMRYHPRKGWCLLGLDRRFVGIGHAIECIHRSARDRRPIEMRFDPTPLGRPYHRD